MRCISVWAIAQLNHDERDPAALLTSRLSCVPVPRLLSSPPPLTSAGRREDRPVFRVDRYRVCIVNDRTLASYIDNRERTLTFASPTLYPAGASSRRYQSQREHV